MSGQPPGRRPPTGGALRPSQRARQALDQRAGAPRRPSEADAADPTDAVYHATGTALISHLCGLAQALRLYEINNATVIQVLGEICDGAHSFSRAIEEPLALSLVEHSFFVNRRLVRMSFNDYRKAQQLRAIWVAIDVGEILLPAAVDLEGLQEFAAHLSTALRTPAASDLTRSAWGGIAARPLIAVEAERAEGTRSAAAVKTYAALVVLARQMLAALKEGRRPAMLPIKRVLQALVDCSAEFEPLLIALARRFAAHNELAVHLANVSLYSLLCARQLGLHRGELMTLATAALLHDLPKATLKDATLNAIERPDALGEPERARVGLHWLNTLHALAAQVGTGDESLARLVVLYESQLEFTRRDLYAAPGAPDAPPDLALFSRIIAVGDALDTWCWPRAGREPRAPHQALMALADAAGRRLDPQLARLILEIMGCYPPGSALLLSSGETAVVKSAATEDGDPERPFVALVADAEGQPLEPRDLNLASDRGREVVWSFEAARLGLNALACFSEPL